MPDLVTHCCFGQDVRLRLCPETAARLRPELFVHGCYGPDPWFSLGFWGGRRKKNAVRGGVMHHERCGEFLMALADEAAKGPAGDELFSYLAGFLCHYALDQTAHPYIVYRSGDYDGTADARQNRGLHTRLERAIDSRVIRERFGLKPWRFPFLRRVLTLRRFPEPMRAGLDAAYARVYGWPGVYDDLNACVRDQRLLYAVVKDPLGLFNAAARLLDDGKSENDLCVLSYYRKDVPPAVCDVENTRHTPWQNAFDLSLRSTESFGELYARALDKAVLYIEVSRRYVFEHTDDGLARLLGSVSYDSGLPWADPRNAGPGRYAPYYTLRSV